MMKFTRQSPFQIFIKIPAAIPLVAIALFLQIFLEPQNTAAIILSSSFNIFIITVFVIHGIMVWRNSGIGARYGVLKVKNGFLKTTEKRISFPSLVSAEIQTTPFKALFRTSRVDFYSPAHGSPDSTVYLGKKRLAELKRSLHFTDSKNCPEHFYASIKKTVITALSSSNAAAGLLLAIPFLRNAGSLLGNDPAAELYFKLNSSAEQLLPFLDPVGIAVATLFFAGWLVNVLDTLFKYSHFKAWRSRNTIFTSSGLIGRHTRIINAHRVYAIDIRETLFTGIVGVGSVYMLAEGYKNRKGRRIPLLPATGLGEQNRVLPMFFPYSGLSVCTVHPPRTARIKFFIPALNTLWITVLLCYKLSAEFPVFKGFFLSISIFCILIALWHLSISALAVKRAGLRICPDCVIVCGIRGLTVHTQKINRGKIEEIKITRNPFQQREGLCDLIIRAKGISSPVRCKHLPYKRLCEAVKRLK